MSTSSTAMSKAIDVAPADVRDPCGAGSNLEREIGGLVTSGLLSRWQADRLPALVASDGFEELWANPYYRAVREHTRAYIECVLARIGV